MKRIFAILCAAVALICSMLSISVSASLQSDLARIDSDTLARLNAYPYFLCISGHYDPSGAEYTRVLCFNSPPDFTATFYNVAYCNITESAVKFGTGGAANHFSASQICGFYFYENPNPSIQSVLVFDEMCTNIPDALTFYESLSPNQSYLERVQAGTVEFPETDTFSSAVEKILNPAPDPTEQPTGSGGIPEDWITGGHTVPPVETMTLPSDFNAEDALDEMISSQETLPSSVVSAIGGFWFIFDEFLEASGLHWFVLLSLTIVCISWFLGRRV